MKKQFIFVAIFITIVLGFGFLFITSISYAQFSDENSGDYEMYTIKATDLGIENPGILPTSYFYFFKEWRRGITRLFTFKKISKAELELKITNEKAAEMFKVQETKPDSMKAFTAALENYAKATERLQARLLKLEETSENPNVAKLLLKLNEQTLKHAVLLNQITERWSTDPYVENTSVVNPRGVKDNYLQGAVDIVQKKIQEIVVTATEKEKDIKEKATEEITHAEIAIGELESTLAEFSINKFDVSNNRAINTKGTGAVARTEKTGPIRIDSTPARISTNLTIERQTPKRDFGDRMKAGLETAGGILANGKTHLVLAKKAFTEEKFGEAFGEARSAEVLAKNGLRILSGILRADTGGLEDGAKSIIPQSSAMPIVPGIDAADDKETIPEEEKRVFPETNNRTVCDDREVQPACLRTEILECHDGKWVCIGPANGAKEGQILPIDSVSN